MHRVVAAFSVLCLSAFSFGEALRAQCANVWLPGSAVPGVDGPVHTLLMWDPDGVGPATAKLVAGGGFDFAGSVAAKNLAAWDPTTATWSPLAPALSGPALTSAVLPDGSLVVGGPITFIGTTWVKSIARWDGATWTSLGDGIDGGTRTVNSVVTLANGDLVAAGWFDSAGGVTARNIARWNGTAWSPLGSGVTGLGSSFVTSVVELANGDLVVGGRFNTAGGVAAANLARWNGSSWSAIGTGTNDSVSGLTRMSNGDLLVTGRFTTIDGVAANRVARWDGAVFTLLGSGLDDEVANSIELPNGDVVVAGNFQNAGGVPSPGLARWDGAAWSPLGTGLTGSPAQPATAAALTTLPSGELVVGGNFLTAGGVVASNIARWDGTNWSPMNPGFLVDSNIGALEKTSSGDLVAGGQFAVIDDIRVDNIARWNGTAWSAMGTGLGGAQAAVSALVELPNGDVIAGGSFTTAGTTTVNGIARWNGTTWSALGTGMTGLPFSFPPRVAALVAMPNGDVIAGGSFQFAGGVSVGNIARWNGTSWSSIGGGTDSEVSALALMPSGDLLAAGGFTQAGGAPANRIASWNGSSWTPLGAGTNGAVLTVAVRPDGTVFAGGRFITAGGQQALRIARWDGATWSALGSGLSHSPANILPFVNRLELLPNGDLVAGGLFNLASGSPANNIARWDGTSWSTFGAGLDDFALAFEQDGTDLVVGGAFQTAGGQVAMRLARLTTTCPAVAASTGSGCNGSTLSATTLPWVDAPFRATGTGLPNLALVLTVTSVTPVAPPLPLNAVFAEALPGCDLLVAPDILQVLFPVSGVATSELFLPNTPPLVGVTFFHQMVPFELDAQGNLVAITATNALQLTAGAF